MSRIYIAVAAPRDGANLSVACVTQLRRSARIADSHANKVEAEGHEREDPFALHLGAVLPSLAAEDEEFWKAVRALPKRQSQAIALFYLEDLSIAQISEILDCAQGTVKAHLHKGRARLANKLGLEAGETT